MTFKHLDIHVNNTGSQFMGSWRLCESHNIDRSFGESEIPLGKRLTEAKLEDFVLNAVAQANQILLKDPTVRKSP